MLYLSPPFIDQRGDESRPASLMRGAQTESGIAVKVFVEQNQIAPIRVALELLHSPINRSVATFIPREDRNQTIGKTSRYLIKRNWWFFRNRIVNLHQWPVGLPQFP